MGKLPAAKYWECHQGDFPFQVEVPHMSSYDPDPKQVQQKIAFNFLRVPFDSIAHWGFEEEEHLEAFKKMAGVSQK